MTNDADSSTRYDPTGVACRKMNCRKEALYRWGKAGTIGVIRTPGGRFRWAVEEFIARQRLADAVMHSQAGA